MKKSSKPPISPKVRLELARRIVAKRSLIAYTNRLYPSYRAGWVHHDIAERLERFKADVEAQLSPRLMLLVPPRHGKSELASIRFPGWCIGHHPEWEIINCGYNLDLPMRFSRRVRDQIKDPGFLPLFPTARIDPDSQSAEAWNTTMGGGFTAAGVGGGITGKGATILIVDDPIKNQDEADSILIRDSLWDWYWSTAYTRLAPGGGVLIIQTWWHDDDLAGRLQQKMRDHEISDQFTIIKYPALSEKWEYRNRETDLIERFDAPLKPEHVELRLAHRADGLSSPIEVSRKHILLRMPDEALHPERYDEDMLKSIRGNQPPRIWSALYQQNPVPDEGVYFKKEYMRFEPQAPAAHNVNVFQAWDFAIGQKQISDWTVGITLIQDARDYLHVVDLVRAKIDSFTIVEEMLNAAEKWSVDRTAPLVLGVEDGQIWKSIKPLLEKRMAERKFYPPYEVMRPLTDKLARARPLQGRMQQGRVYILKDMPWTPLIEKELLRFPAGQHDDIVDALSWACHLCIGRSPRAQRAEKKIESWRDKLAAHLRGGTGNSHMSA